MSWRVFQIEEVRGAAVDYSLLVPYIFLLYMYWDLLQNEYVK